MTREEAIAKMNATSAKFDRIGQLRKEAEDLMMTVIPSKYEDGEVFLMNPEIFDQIHGKIRETYKLQGFTEREMMFMSNLEYVGTVGRLIIKRGV